MMAKGLTRRMRMGALAVGALTMLALGAACTDTDEPNGGTGGGGGSAVVTSIDVSLTNDFTIVPSNETARAGEVSFRSTNNGALPHELIVLQTDLAFDALPTDGPVVDVSQLTVLGETAELNPGERETVTLQLTAGEYLLLCNIPGHYQAGMYTAFTVE